MTSSSAEMHAGAFQAIQRALRVSGTELRPPRPDVAARLLPLAWHVPLRMFYELCDGMERYAYHDASEICLWGTAYLDVRPAYVDFADFLIDSHTYALLPSGHVALMDGVRPHARVARSVYEFLERMAHDPERLFAGA